MLKKIIGPIIFVVIALIIWWLIGPKPIKINAFVGGEKIGFINDPLIINILEEKYNIVVDAVKAGSIEMVTTLNVDGKDVLWPSNPIALEIWKNSNRPFLSDDSIFLSPIVLYSYDIVTKALIQEQIVEKRSDFYYVVNFRKMIEYIIGQKSWEDIQLPELYGKITIFSTDPTKSNSGNMFAGLMANILNHGNVVTMETVDNILPEMKKYFERCGYMEDSSGDIFNNFISTGVGAKPIIVGYENQLSEYIIENEKFINNKIRILYPVPTIWSTHPMIALKKNGKILIEALKDKKIMKIAWEKHGFRSSHEISQRRIKVPEIEYVVQMPNAAVMNKIIDELK